MFCSALCSRILTGVISWILWVLMSLVRLDVEAIMGNVLPRVLLQRACWWWVFSVSSARCAAQTASGRDPMNPDSCLAYP